MSGETIDRKQISVHFDHADFEEGVAQTLASLNKLNSAVENSGNTSSRGFTNLSTQLNQVEKQINNGILPAMDTMQNKFSFFGTMVDQTVRNWATRIQGFFESGIGNIFQVKGGMNEYELKMNSIQTILNGTGRSLEDVKKNLEELNHYADQTIYSFKDMTDNIGKFTNNNVPLEKAVAAIKGIANEAALSGASAAQASHAMYNFSQALSTGAVKQIDWKSIENAQMATTGFKNALLETAVALGTVTKQGEQYMTTTKNAMGKTSALFDAVQFRDTLQYNWLTSDVLTQTLELYATDVSKMNEAEKEAYETKLKGLGFTEEQIKDFEQLGISAAKAATEIKTFSQMCDVVVEAIGTGWADTFELIFGDFAEAKALWTGIGTWLQNAVDAFSDFRNNMLKGWREAGGRNAALQTFINLLNAIDAILRPIGEAFAEVFGTFTGGDLANITKNIEEFTYGLILTNGQVDELKENARIVFLVLNEVIKAIKPFAPAAIGVWGMVKAFTALQLVMASPFGFGSLFGILKMLSFAFMGIQLLKPYIPFEKLRVVLDRIDFAKITNGFIFVARILGGAVYLAFNKLYSLLKDNKIIIAFINFFKKMGIEISRVFDGMEDGKQAIEAIHTAFRDLINDLGKGGEFISGFLDFFTRSKSEAKELSSTLENVTKPVNDSIGIFDKIQTRVENVVGSFNMVAYAAESTEKPIYNVNEGIVTMAEAAQETTEQVADTVEQVESVEKPMHKWVEIIDSLLVKVEDMVPAATPIIEVVRDITSQLENINPIAQNVLDVITTIISKISWAKVIAVGVIIVYINMLKSIDNSVKTVGGTIDRFGAHFDNLFGGIGSSLKNLTDTMGGTFMAITQYFNTLEKQLTRDNFKNTAFGILALAGAFALLAAAVYLLPEDVLLTAAGALAVLAVVVVGVNAAMAKLSTTVNPTGMAALAAGFLIFATSLLAVSASLLIVGAVIAGLSKVTGSLLNAIGFMVTVLGTFLGIAAAGFVAIWAFAGLMSSLGAVWSEVLIGAGVLAAMAGAIYLFGYALDKLVTTMVKIIPIVAGFITAIGVVITGLATGLVAIVKVVTGLDAIPAIFVSILASIGTIALGIVALKVISSSMIIIGANMLIAGGLMGAGALALGVGIATLAVSISMIIPALALVGASIMAFFLGIKTAITNFINAVMSLKTIGEGVEFFGSIISTVLLAVVSIVGILGVFTVALAGMRALVSGLGRDLMFASAGIFLMSLALRSWAAIPADKLLSGGIALITTMMGIAFALKLLNNVSIGKIAGAVLALVVSLYMLTPLAALYGVAWPVLGKGLAIIALGMLAIAGAVKLMENVKAGNFFSISIALAALVGVISYMAALLGAEFAENERSMTAAFVALFALLVTMSISIDAISSTVNKMQSIAKLAGVVAGFSLVVFGIVVALSALANFPADNLLAAAVAISASLLSFSVGIVILAGAAKLLGSTNVLGITLLMLTFAGAMYVLAQGMTAIQGLGWAEILAFILGFAGGIALITAVCGAFGPALTAASIGIAAIALVILAAGAAAVMAGFGFKMMAEGVQVILTAISAFMPLFLQFLTGLADLSDRAQDMINTSQGITAFAQSLVALSIGMAAVGATGIPMAAALLALALGVGAFSLALILASVSIMTFTTSLVYAFETIQPIIEAAQNWGRDLISNFVNGILGGIPDLVDAVVAVATTIWGYLHQSTAEWGPLSTSDQWGGDLVGNIITGMGEKVPELGDTSEMLGVVTQGGFLEGADAEGTGISFLDGLKDSLLSNSDGLIAAVGSIGEKAKEAFGANFNLDGIMGIFNSDYDLDKQIAAATDPHVKERLMAEKELRQLQKERKKDKKNSTFSIDDLLSKFTNTGNEAKDKEAGAATTPDTDTASGTGSGKGSKTSDSELKKQREAARIHEKYLKLSDNLTKQYVESYGDLMKAMGDTNPTETASAAIAKLKDNLYQASITADMTEEELTEAAQNAEKQIVESYDKIKEKTAEVFDGFKEFDSGLTSMTPAKTILKNIEDAATGAEDMENLWLTLSLRKGMDQEYLQELIEGGVEKLSVVRSLVAMNNDEFNQYMSVVGRRKELSEHAANIAMTAQAFALQRDEIIKTAKAQKAYRSEGKRMIDAWNDAFNSGADNATEMCNTIAMEFNNLAVQNGLTFEQLRDQITETTETTEEELEKQINAYTNLSSTVEQWKSTYTTAYQEVKDGLSGLSTDLSDFDLGDEKSGKHLFNNLAKRNKALGEWGRMLNDLASRGLDKKFLSNLAAQGLSSYQEVKGLHSLDNTRLQQMNGLMQSIDTQTEAIAKQYGSNVANKMVEGIDTGLVEAFKKYAITDKIDWDGLAKEAGVNMSLIGNKFSIALADGMNNGIGYVEDAVNRLTDVVLSATQNKIGNVDINARPIVYNDDGSYSTTSTTFQQKWTGDEQTGHYRIGHFATIRNNGTRMTDEELDAYIDAVLGSDDPFGMDAQMENLLYMVADRISTGEYITDANLQQAFQEASAWDENMHNIQDSMYRDQAKLNQSVVVTPVVNLSAAQNDLKTLGTMTEISPLMPYTANPMNQITLPNQSNEDIANAIRSSQYDDTNLVNQVAGLRQDVTTLNDKMGNLQVVMDTGPLVGAIAPKMDTELGTIYRRRNRG